jgi:hypothetical protein
MNNKGQALIEAVFGFVLIGLTICVFGLVVLIGGTHLILDHELDRLTLCLSEKRSASCEYETRKRLSLSTPWLRIEHCHGRFFLGFNGFGKAHAYLLASSRFKALHLTNEKGIQWQPLKFETERHFDEQQMSTASHY